MSSVNGSTHLFSVLLRRLEKSFSCNAIQNEVIVVNLDYMALSSEG